MAEHIERVGKRIRERREELGLTQGEFARRLLVGNPDAAQVSRWERGIHEPTADRKEDIARALETTVADLMAGPRADRHANGDTPDLLGTPLDPSATIDAAMQEQLDRIERDLAAIKAHLGITEQGEDDDFEEVDAELDRQESGQAATDEDATETRRAAGS